MAADPSLVMSKSPGTGLFAHPPKDARALGGSSAAKQRHCASGQEASKGATHMVHQEEERVNGQLVEILERRCAKLQRQLDEQTEAKNLAEQMLASANTELDELRPLNKSLQDQIKRLCEAQRQAAEERRLSVKQSTALQALEVERVEAQKEATHREREIKQLKEEAQRRDAEWRARERSLVAEAKSSMERMADAEAKLHAQEAEAERLTQHAQALVHRYEEESARRLELEERCLALEERMQDSDRKLRADVETAQQKAKKSAELQHRMEERCKALELEAQELRGEVPPSAAKSPGASGRAYAGRSCPPPEPNGRKDGKAISSAASATALASQSTPSNRSSRAIAAGSHAPRGQAHATALGEDAGRPQLAANPPGAIRRAGSVPSRKGPIPLMPPSKQGLGYPARKDPGEGDARPLTGCSSARGATPTRLRVAASEPPKRPPVTDAGAPRQAGFKAAQRPSTSNSRVPSEEAGDLDIHDAIPSETDDSSWEGGEDIDGELITTIKPGCTD